MGDGTGKTFLESLSPKAAFKVGLISGLAVMFVIGFFIMLGLFLNKGEAGGNKLADNNGGTIVNNGGTNPTPTTITLKAVDTNNDWIRGNKKAKVSVIEFSDIDCPFCQNFHSTMQQIMNQYGDDINWVYRHFPLTSLHPEAEQKAEAAECAGEQGGNDAFWEILDTFFSSSTEKMADVPGMIQNMGLDVDKFNTCLSSGKYASKVSDMANQAQAAGGRGTPYSIIVAGDKKIPINGALPLETVKAQIESVLN